MKKQIILGFLLFYCASVWSQNFIKSTAPCNDALMQKTPGRWIRIKNNVFAPNLDKAQIQEMLNRLDNIQLLVLKTYPTPIGVDAAWFPSVNDELFGSQLKFSKTSDGGSKYDLVNGIPVAYCSYACGFFKYSCGREPYDIRTGYPGETTTHLAVYANNLNNFFFLTGLGGDLGEVMRIDGRPIRMMPAIKGTWKGYTLYCPEAGSVANLVLLHRDGVLPYIPVTRRQYLDRCIDYIPKFYDPGIKSAESMPVRTLEEHEAERNKALEKYKKDYGNDPKRLKSVTDYYLSTHPTDQEQRDELVKKARKLKEDQLKHYKDELEATTAAKLLDSPAIISLYLFDVSNNPIFSKEEAGGRMLVTENPAYIRKDLPKYVPQFLVMAWSCGDWKPQQDVCKAVEAYFPIEKLQAMIDK